MPGRKEPLSVTRGALLHGRVRLPVYYYILDEAKRITQRTGKKKRVEHIVGAILTQWYEDCQRADEAARVKATEAPAKGA